MTQPATPRRPELIAWLDRHGIDGNHTLDNGTLTINRNNRTISAEVARVPADNKRKHAGTISSYGEHGITVDIVVVPWDGTEPPQPGRRTLIDQQLDAILETLDTAHRYPHTLGTASELIRRNVDTLRTLTR